jgi:hypothetical protein
MERGSRELGRRVSMHNTEIGSPCDVEKSTMQCPEARLGGRERDSDVKLAWLDGCVNTDGVVPPGVIQITTGDVDGEERPSRTTPRTM